MKAFFTDPGHPSKVGDRNQGRLEGSLFNSYNTEVSGRALFLSLDSSTLPLIHTLYCWELSKEVSSTIFKVFGMSWPGIEARSPGTLANTLPTRPMSRTSNFPLNVWERIKNRLDLDENNYLPWNLVTFQNTKKERNRQRN